MPNQSGGQAENYEEEPDSPGMFNFKKGPLAMTENETVMNSIALLKGAMRLKPDFKPINVTDHRRRFSKIVKTNSQTTSPTKVHPI